jgi:methyl-accepting chemotaxis protein
LGWPRRAENPEKSRLNAIATQLAKARARYLVFPKANAMRTLSITARMMALLLLPVLVIAAMGYYMTAQNNAAARAERIDELRRQVDTVISMVVEDRAAAEAAGAAPEAALDAALAATQPLRFGDNDYFFAYEGTVVRALGSNPAKVGADFVDLQDSSGLYMIREFARQVAETGEAIVHYEWPRGKDGAPEPKISYARLVPGTTVWLGTGVYVSDLVAQEKAAFLRLGIIVAVAMLALVLPFLLIARSIVLPLRRVNARMHDLAEGDVDAAVPETTARDDVGEMARALEVFRRQAADIGRLEREKAAAESAAAAERHAMMEDLSRSVGEILASASAGDFSRRVERRFDDPALQRLSDDLNALIATLASGLDETNRVMAGLAEGDLGVSMTGDFRGAFATLRDNVNHTVARLGALVSEAHGLSQGIVREGRAIADSAHDLSQRAESQAASLEETAATMTEMAATVKSNADNAAEAARTSQESRGQAQRGAGVAEQAVEAMRGIEASAGKIAEIVGVIDGFAFQTNLLALNASVEAARAGEAGKGFAVVASEVRSLAQRSADAARDIKTLIDESGEKVSDGVRLVEESGAVLADLQSSIAASTARIDEIAAATREQTTGVDEISAAMGSLDRITQENSALAEQSAGAARTLADQGEALDRAMAAFRLDARAEAGLRTDAA